MHYDVDGHILAVYGPHKGEPIPMPGDPGYLPGAVKQVLTPYEHIVAGTNPGPVKVNRGSW